MDRPATGFLLVAIPALFGAVPAVAADMDEGQAKSKMKGAGYANIANLHEVNMGEWMADADKDGRHAMIVLYPDGTVSLREKVDVPPAKPASAAPPDPSASQSTAKP